MFERFTAESRQVLVKAQEEAARQGAAYLGTEHLLLGLLDGKAASLLTSLGADTDKLRVDMRALAEPGPALATGRPPFTAQAKKVLELSLREALDLEDAHIDPKHLLLGLLREGEGPAAQALVEARVTVERVRALTEVSVGGRVNIGRRRSIGDIWDFRTPGPPIVATSGAHRLHVLARELAGGGRITTVHYLRALLVEKNGLAARVLQQLGVTEEKINAIAEELGVEGTSDEGPEERRARQVRIKLGSGREVTIEDEDVVRQLHELASEGDDALRDALRRLTED